MNMCSLSDSVSSQNLLMCLRADIVKALPIGFYEDFRNFTNLGLCEVILTRWAIVTFCLGSQVRWVLLMSLRTHSDNVLKALILHRCNILKALILHGYHVLEALILHICHILEAHILHWDGVLKTLIIHRGHVLEALVFLGGNSLKLLVGLVHNSLKLSVPHWDSVLKTLVIHWHRILKTLIFLGCNSLLLLLPHTHLTAGSFTLVALMTSILLIFHRLNCMDTLLISLVLELKLFGVSWGLSQLNILVMGWFLG